MSTPKIVAAYGLPEYDAGVLTQSAALADYFEQDNDFVSPPELEFEPNDGQPGSVVLSKASNLNLNLAVNSNYTYIPGSGSFQSMK